MGWSEGTVWITTVIVDLGPYILFHGYSFRAMWFSCTTLSVSLFINRMERVVDECMNHHSHFNLPVYMHPFPPVYPSILFLLPKPIPTMQITFIMNMQ